MFVYDASNKYTFDTLMCLIETITEIEKSEKRGQKTVMYTPKKIILGNKKDLVRKRLKHEKSDFDKLSSMSNKEMSWREVSAFTN